MGSILIGFFEFVHLSKFTCPSMSAFTSDMLYVHDVSVDSQKHIIVLHNMFVSKEINIVRTTHLPLRRKCTLALLVRVCVQSQHCWDRAVRPVDPALCSPFRIDLHSPW